MSNSSTSKDHAWWRQEIRFEDWWHRDLFDHGNDLSRRRERGAPRIRINGPARLLGFLSRLTVGWLAVITMIVAFAGCQTMLRLVRLDQKGASAGSLALSASLGVLAWWGLRRFAITTKRIERSVLNRLVLALLHLDDSFRWSPPTIPETRSSLPAGKTSATWRALRQSLVVTITFIRLCFYLARLPLQLLLKAGLIGTTSGLTKELRARLLSSMAMAAATAGLLWGYRFGDTPRGQPAAALIGIVRSLEVVFAARLSSPNEPIAFSLQTIQSLAEVAGVFALVLVALLSIAEQLRMAVATRKLITKAPSTQPTHWTQPDLTADDCLTILHWSDLHLCRAEEGDLALRVEVAYKKHIKDQAGLSRISGWLTRALRLTQAEEAEDFCGGNRRFRIWCETHARAISKSHAIVLTGDITDTGAPSEFEAFMAIASSKATTDNLVVCPGNHDLNFSAPSLFVVEAKGRIARTLRCLRMLSFLSDIQGLRASVLDGDRLVNLREWVNARKQKAAFQRFLDRLDANQFRRVGERASVYACAREVQHIYERAFPLVVKAEQAKSVRFLVFDSVAEASSFVTNAYGHVPPAALARASRIRQLLTDMPLAVVLHHHLLLLDDAPAPKAAMMLVDNADQVLSFLREGRGRQLVFHGHKHVAQKLELGLNDPITIVSAPSTPLGDEARGVTNPTAEQLSVACSATAGLRLMDVVPLSLE